jgi:hypothetical protein
MPTPPEAPAGSVAERTLHGAAFGLQLEIDPSIEIPGIPSASGLNNTAPSHSHAGVGTAPDGADSRRTGASLPPTAGLDTAGATATVVYATTTPPPSPSPFPPTHVRLDPPELQRRWSSAAYTAQVVRELRDGDAVLLTVELAHPAGYLLHAPGVGRILVSPDGGELLCDPEPGSAELTTLIPAQALPLAATLRGLEVLHASGVVLGEQAMLFAGAPGAGKSSLAAALLHRGALLLSDDTVALELRDGAPIAHPGAALLHLRHSEHDRLSERERAVLGAPATFPHKPRYHPRVSTSPAPFGGLFLLERATHGPPIERAEVVDPFVLLASTFNLSVRTPERLVRHLDLAAALATTERIYRLRVQPGMNATQLASAVREQLPER